MNIVICIKQTPDTTVEKRLNDDLRLDRTVEAVINPFDEYTVEQSLKIKDEVGGEVTALCMGLDSAQATLRKALAMGVDKAVLVTDPALVGCDIWATAHVLAQALRKLPYDLVLCGPASTDAMSGLVPGGIAEALGLPQLTYAAKVMVRGDKVTIHRQADQGMLVVESQLPALVGVTKAIGEPRYPSLRGIMQAQRKPIQKWSLADVGVDPSLVGVAGSREQVVGYTKPPARQKGEVVKESDPQAAAKRIVDFLVAKKML